VCGPEYSRGVSSEGPTITGVHLVGSVNSPDAESTFRVVADHVGPLAHRIPDGEVGERFYWIQFQNDRFDQTPGLTRIGEPGARIRDRFDTRPVGFADGYTADGIALPSLGYADAAIDSYQAFRALRDAGTITPGTRFQVSLPTPLGVVGAFIQASDRPTFEPLYEAAMLVELERILESVPHEDLAIQWDCAVEFLMLEGDRVGAWGTPPWWDGHVFEGVLDRLVRLASAVPSDVEVGFHLCYGDVEEAHFVQPADAGILASVLRALLERTPRHVDFVHLPVPIERSDEAYFAPLAGIDTGDTEIYLGLVHHEDGLDGALRRVAAALTALPRFGIATECGFGRGPAERTAPLLDLHRQIVETVDAAA
jgi:hypothetical protein